MARATITVQNITPSGAALTFVAPSGTGVGNGVQAATNGSTPTLLVVRNTDSGAHVVTVVANGKKASGVALPDIDISVAAGAIRAIFVPPAYYATAGKLLADVDGTTGMGFAAIAHSNKF